MHVTFRDIAVLPTATIAPAGPVGREFLALGVDTFTSAAAWLCAAPYGRNAAGGPFAVFRDGCGTCETKHVTIVTLAVELGLDVAWIWGLYALDDSVIPGAGAVLERAGLPFVPNVHCFVRFEGHDVDLTEGNCTGKRGQIEEYLSLAEADVDGDMASACCAAAEDLARRDDRFAGLTAAGILAVLGDCVAANPVLCQRSD